MLQHRLVAVNWHLHLAQLPVLQCLRTRACSRKRQPRLRRARKSVVFVLEDFHLFMKRARPTTLYNLLDSLQALHVTAAVIGVTHDQAAVDSMEKRARSRFSHRKVVLSLPCAAFADAQVRAPAPVHDRAWLGTAASRVPIWFAV